MYWSYPKPHNKDCSPNSYTKFSSRKIKEKMALKTGNALFFTLLTLVNFKDMKNALNNGSFGCKTLSNSIWITMKFHNCHRTIANYSYLCTSVSITVLDKIDICKVFQFLLKHFFYLLHAIFYSSFHGFQKWFDLHTFACV